MSLPLGVSPLMAQSLSFRAETAELPEGPWIGETLGGCGHRDPAGDGAGRPERLTVLEHPGTLWNIWLLSVPPCLAGRGPPSPRVEQLPQTCSWAPLLPVVLLPLLTPAQVGAFAEP